MEKSPSLVSRAILALILLVGFYLLAAAVIATLLFIPYFQIYILGQVLIKVTIICVIAAGIILWSIIPRPDKFVAPGPLLARDRHPELYREIDSIAQKTGQQPPESVYVDLALNAWVADRGGIMGLGSRRVMGIGLPLLKMATLREFRAVLAHEFGHYYSGDTKLGPWLYKTRAIINRTLKGLAKTGSLAQLPFIWYGNLFLRLTQAVSRSQEFTADRIAARTVGKDAILSVLKKLCSLGDAYDIYWNKDVAPVLDAGFKPPITDGFRRFMESPHIITEVNNRLREELGSTKVSLYDSHPPLASRIAALDSLESAAGEIDDNPAMALLGDAERLEREILESLSPQAAGMQDLSWEETGEVVLLPLWRETMREFAPVFKGIPVADLPDKLWNLEALVDPLSDICGGVLGVERVPPLLSAVLGSMLAVLLTDRGYKLVTGPGIPAHCTGMKRVIEPFYTASRLVGKKITPSAWVDLCREWRLDTVCL